ncbi:potassium-transporting ATPase subunit KdpA [Myceligenerans pegani]|uniref:Potassium-transporting ATPase potassium-binding subunit n=1 Tax=Myceligenerans pegani TaxID=2776917 RepID=A0ABR9MXE6_9MICO|nr:potassium-transporting ATPase subunit KdpA [Myceligenerans sp. TRM 65318]MBE1875676.1 potassium-transporting ATPase subunit KdpA [Myceligenerans sp. TRM 65318]MBE3017947.1 potassium-transporting ATPase subunit KdpA [Myceligenerans sp. TRM 65318]
MSPAVEIWPAVAQIGILVLLLALVHVPFGAYMARVYTSPAHLRVERAFYRAVRVDPDAEQRWMSYLLSLLGFSLVSVLFLYALERLQGALPWNLGLAGIDPAGAWSTAVSFTTNTNWQWYSGEATASHLTQMAGFAVQNFVSASVGMAVAIALVRGFARSGTDARIGNFWTDLTRGVVRILLPISFVAAFALMAGGVIQNLDPHTAITTIEGATQHLLGGPVASQEAIKDLGTNGGGFFNANSSHPFENPNPITNLIEIFLLLVIPFTLPRTFGIMVGDKRQGWTVLAVMAGLWAASLALTTWAELAGPGSAPEAAGAAMEGKEVRFGLPASALFAVSTTATSTGSVNSMHDSFTAPGGGMLLFNILLGEVAPGGVGAGLYGMLVLAVVAVFIAGLMVGRTPEYLGKKIGRHEMTLVALYVLTVPALVLIGTAVSVVTGPGLAGIQDPGAHGLSEALYGFASAANNNGSAFAGLSTGTPWYEWLQGLAMLFGRFVPIALVLALAGRLASQTKIPASAGTLPTHRPLFAGLLAGVTLIVVGLTFIPVLSLGPVVESLS